MSFQDVGSRGAGGHASKSQPKQGNRGGDDDAYEKDLRALIQKMQDASRHCVEQLERAERGVASTRVRKSIDEALQQCRDRAQEAETLFRDWTVSLAGEPAKKHRKRFSYEKLQKAFEDEVMQLKDLARRSVAAQPEFSDPARDPEAQFPPAHGPGSRSAEDDWASQQQIHLEDTGAMNRMAQERDEGIRRINTSVREVNQMMQDMASLVADQGDVLTSIEGQAELASHSTKDAVGQLKKAADRSRGSREQMLCLLVAATVVFFFIILPHLHATELHPSLAPGSGGT